MISIWVGCWGRSCCGYLRPFKSCSSVLTWAALPGLGPHGTKTQLSLCSFTSDHMGCSPSFSASIKVCNPTAGMWAGDVWKKCSNGWGLGEALRCLFLSPYRFYTEKERQAMAEVHYEVSPGCAQATHLAPHSVESVLAPGSQGFCDTVMNCSKEPALNTAAAKRGFICVQEEEKRKNYTQKKKEKWIKTLAQFFPGDWEKERWKVKLLRQNNHVSTAVHVHGEPYQGRAAQHCWKMSMGSTRLGNMPYPCPTATPALLSKLTAPHCPQHPSNGDASANCSLHAFSLAATQTLEVPNAGPCLHPWKSGSASGPSTGRLRDSESPSRGVWIAPHFVDLSVAGQIKDKTLSLSLKWHIFAGLESHLSYFKTLLECLVLCKMGQIKSCGPSSAELVWGSTEDYIAVFQFGSCSCRRLLEITLYSNALCARGSFHS